MQLKSCLVIVTLLMTNILIASEIRPGEVKLLTFDTLPNGRLFCRNKEFQILKKGKVSHAIVSESYFSKLDAFTCSLKAKNKTLKEFPFKVIPRDYPIEHLTVAPEKAKFSKKDQRLKDFEEETYQKVYAKPLRESQFGSIPFQKPLESVVTSQFGVKRLFNGITKSFHVGADFRAPIGTKIRVANTGKVVFSGNLFLSGNVVVVDHGLDIFTVYNHLSKSHVKVGDLVKKGDVIGLSGVTGRITGPHLHWDAYVNGEYVDGLSLVEETKNL